mmetsp:Transcript_170169/g.545719  ORF Transcript_170169/g.545719 Transcript_170169/m.545719 type:complete len:99 (+) Transcript_170169:125-421(+)
MESQCVEREAYDRKAQRIPTLWLWWFEASSQASCDVHFAALAGTLGALPGMPLACSRRSRGASQKGQGMPGARSRSMPQSLARPPLSFKKPRLSDGCG